MRYEATCIQWARAGNELDQSVFNWNQFASEPHTCWIWATDKFELNLLIKPILDHDLQWKVNQVWEIQAEVLGQRHITPQQLLAELPACRFWCYQSWPSSAAFRAYRIALVPKCSHFAVTPHTADHAVFMRQGISHILWLPVAVLRWNVVISEGWLTLRVPKARLASWFHTLVEWKWKHLNSKINTWSMQWGWLPVLHLFTSD